MFQISNNKLSVGVSWRLVRGTVIHTATVRTPAETTVTGHTIDSLPPFILIHRRVLNRTPDLAQVFLPKFGKFRCRRSSILDASFLGKRWEVLTNFSQIFRTPIRSLCVIDPCPAEMLSVLIGRTLISHIAPYGGVASSYDVKSSNTTSTNCLISNTFFFFSVPFVSIYPYNQLHWHLICALLRLFRTSTLVR